LIGYTADLSYPFCTGLQVATKRLEVYHRVNSNSEPVRKTALCPFATVSNRLVEVVSLRREWAGGEAAVTPPARIGVRQDSTVADH
jgi:hypothetical protein